MNTNKKVAKKVKICCIKDIEEADLAIKYGATSLGLVSKMPSGPGVIDNKAIRQIAGHVQQPISTFLLTSETDPRKIIDHYHKTSTTTIQIVDHIPLAGYDLLRKELPDVDLVQVIHVQDDKAIDQAKSIAKKVDHILLDSGNPHSLIRQLGGTGRIHNWSISKKIVASVDTPVYLAGGLNANNVLEAVETVDPYGIDLCTGVRTNGKLDESKLKEFFSVINSFS